MLIKDKTSIKKKKVLSSINNENVTLKIAFSLFHVIRILSLINILLRSNGIGFVYLKNGGLELLDAQTHNQTLMMKWLWITYHGSDSILATFLKR